MNLPATIKNVLYYKISGSYSFRGQLIITRGVLYFFPEGDLEQERINSQTRKYTRGPRPEPRTRYLSELQEKGLWVEDGSGIKLHALLDGHIAELKQSQLTANFSSTLPLPSRFARDDIKNLSISFIGVLSFEAQSDKQDFAVGIFKKKILKVALKEGGFL